jgi:hypothetical protein
VPYWVGQQSGGERHSSDGSWEKELLARCRRRGIDPSNYLRDVLTRLPNLTNPQVSELVPAGCLKNQKPLRRLASRCSCSSQEVLGVTRTPELVQQILQ